MCCRRSLLGIVTFSKITNVLLFPPVVLWQIWRRQWRRAIVSSIAFAVVTLGLYGANMAISGEWNYQGGEDRASFYNEYPLQTPGSSSAVGVTKERNEALTEIIFDRRVFATNLLHNVGYFFVGRYTGMLAYCFPAFFALVAFLVTVRRRPSWEYFVVAAFLGQMLVFVIGTPYTWHGGGGSVGNRYFMSAYGLFIFLMPVTGRLWVGLVPWICGALFTAPLVLNPFFASFYPGSYAKSGPLRWLPVELTLVYDWPTNTERDRTVVWLGDHPGGSDMGFQLYFFDDNRYMPEADKSFWVKGESRSEFVIKTDRAISRAVFTLTAGPVAHRRRRLGRPAQSTRRAEGGRAAARVLQPPARVSVSGGLADLDRVGLEQPRIRSELLRGRLPGHPLPWRAGRSDADSAMSRIAVITSSPPMVEGGHMVIARSLVQALRDAGHEAEVVVTPQNRFGRQASAYYATWLTDVGSSGGQRIDQVISLRYPSYAVRHPRHVCWLNHTMREYYDLWDRFQSRLEPAGANQGERAPASHPRCRSLSPDAQRQPAVRTVANDSEPARDVAGAAFDSALSAAAATAVSLR